MVLAFASWMHEGEDAGMWFWWNRWWLSVAVAGPGIFTLNEDGQESDVWYGACDPLSALPMRRSCDLHVTSRTDALSTNILSPRDGRP
eukprot:1146482-Rhodomonas_salina.2